MHGDIFYPTALLRLILPTDVGHDVGLHRPHLPRRAASPTASCARGGSASMPSLVGGIAYMLGGPIASDSSRPDTTASCSSARCCRSRSGSSCAASATARTGRGARSRSRSGSRCSARIRSCCSTCCSPAARSRSSSRSPPRRDGVRLDASRRRVTRLGIRAGRRASRIGDRRGPVRARASSTCRGRRARAGRD